MTQIPSVQIPQYPMAPQPNYNAVKIDINNPQVNAPDCTQSQNKQTNSTDPVYSYPPAPIYEMPKQSIYNPQPTPSVSQPPAVQEVPVVPPPVVVPAAPKAPTAPVTSAAPTAPVAPTQPITETTPVAAATIQPVEVKTPEVAAPKVDVNEFITKLTSADYEQQATAMETIADMAQNSPQKATELLDTRVIDTLLGIMSKDTSKIEGPTAQQIQIRTKIMSGQQVSEAEKAEANKITPMELAERNKQYSIYTVAILQKLYGSEIEKMNKTVVPLTELPGAAGVVEQIKNNPNPMVRAAGIDALSYIQRPEYKQDLTTLFTVAQKDQDTNVQQAAAKALEKLGKLNTAPANAAPTAEQKTA